MASSAAKIDFTPEVAIDFVPDEAAPQAAQIDFTPDVDPVAEGAKATMGAVQALDVMAAPRGLDWSDANEQLDFQRYQEANALEAQAREKLRSGQGTEPEAMALFRQADEQRKNISPFSSFGKARAISQSDAAAQAERDALGERQTPGEFLGQLLGPGITAETQPITSNVARNIGPAIGGAVGGATFGGPFGGALGFGMGLVGGLMGAQVGGAGQEAVLQSTESSQETQARQERAAEESAASPIGSQIGAMASNAPFFRPSISNLAAAFSGNREALRNVGIAAGIGAGVEAAVRGRELTMGDLATGALGNAIMSEPTKLGRMLFSHPGSMAKQIVDGPAHYETPAVELTSGMTNRGTTSTADVFANVPRRTQLPEPNAQQISEPSTPDGGVRTPEVPSQNEPLPASGGSPRVQPSGQGEPLAETTPEAPREVAPQETTGIRNSIVDERRRAAQMEERELPARREFGTILDEAKAVLSENPEAGSQLVEGLKENVRPLTDQEDAILTLEQNRRELAREEAIDAVNRAETDEARDVALERLAFAENKAFDIYQVGQNAGTQNARGLNARRLMIQRDFSLAKMLNETRAIKNQGKPLSLEQTAEITQLHQRIAELEGKLQNKEDSDASKVAQEEYQRVLRDTREEARVAAKEKRSVVDFFESQAEKARQRIIARRGRLQVTVDPLNIAGLVDEAIIGASHVARGLRDFTQWSKKMLSEFGDRIRPQLQALFDRATEIEAENAATFSTKDQSTPEQVMEKADQFGQRLVYDLARAHVRSGVQGFENVMAAVEKDLKPRFPEVTQRQIHDALSGYGKTIQPSKDADLKTLREYRSIARLMSQLEDAQKGIPPLKTGMQRDKTTARVRELQKQVSDAMEAAGLKRTREDQLASSLDAAKTRLRNATEELQRKIDRGDYTERPKREQQVDQERINLEFDLAKVKQKYQQGLIEARRARRTTGQKIWDSTVETFNLSRQLLTSGDLPPVVRQGLFSIGRPRMMLSALKDSLGYVDSKGFHPGAMFSEKKRFAIDREIANRPNAPLYQRAKLYLAKDTGQTLTQQEEAYMGNWFKELPRWTVVGPFLRASERSYNTFLNKLRADTFDAAVKAYDVAPTDTVDLRDIADKINTFTGRAKLPGRALEQGAGALNAFLFAPRFTASRFKIVAGQPLWTGSAKSRKFALEQYARTLAGASLFYGLARMAGADIETDPRSTDFLKIRFGNTRIDPLGGLIQVTNFLTRVVTGESKNAKGKIVDLRSDKKSGQSMGSMIGSFLRTKLNPVTGGAIDIATGKDLTGKPVTPGGLAVRMTVPISFQDIAQTMEEQGVPKGTALWILSLFGAGLQTYGNRR